MVTGATFALWLSLYFYVPFLPLRALDLGASNTMVGAVIAAYAIAQVGLRIPIGVGADLLGRRRPFALIALAASALGALWLAVSPSPWSLFLARALTGVAGAGWVAVSVLYASYFSEAETGRAMSRIMAVNAIGLVLATFVGGLLADALDPLATFYAGVVVGGIGVGMLLLAPEPPLERSQRYSQATFWEVARTPLLLTVSAIGIAVQFVSFATSFGFIPVYAERIGASSAAIGNLTTVMFATSVAGTIGAPWLARRVGYSAALGIGAAAIALSVGVVPLLDSVWALGASQALGGLGRGGMNALLITLSVLAVAPAQRATAMGVYQALYAIGMLSGPIVSGIVVDQTSIEAVFVLSAAVSVLGGAIALTARMPAAEV
ncbi:MAG: MFS transporter [Dehalococcoidia bacterium]